MGSRFSLTIYYTIIMIRFNRLILLLRICLFIAFTFLFCNTLINTYRWYYAEMPDFISPTFSEIYSVQGFILLLWAYFWFSNAFRLFKLLWFESNDIRIEDDKILLKNILTRKTSTFLKGDLRGFRIERYHWNFIKLVGIRPLIFHESDMIVLYSNFRSVICLKKLNYWGFKKITVMLEEQNYPTIPARKRLFGCHKQI